MIWVNDIIAALVNAFAVLGGLERLDHVLVGRLHLFGRRSSEPGILLIVKIKLLRVIEAGVGVRTTVHTTLGRTLGRVLCRKMSQGAKALNALARLADDPLQNIQIVAGLLQDHTRAFLAVLPISANEAMTLMDISHMLCVLDAYDIADHSIVYHILQGAEEPCKSQNVANKHAHVLSLVSLRDHQTLLGRGRDRLLQQDIVSCLDRRHRRSKMISVHRGNNRRVRDLAHCKNRLPAFKAHLCGDSVLLHNILSAVTDRLCHGNLLHQLIM